MELNQYQKDKVAGVKSNLTAEQVETLRPYEAQLANSFFSQQDSGSLRSEDLLPMMEVYNAARGQHMNRGHLSCHYCVHEMRSWLGMHYFAYEVAKCRRNSPADGTKGKGTEKQAAPTKKTPQNGKKGGKK